MKIEREGINYKVQKADGTSVLLTCAEAGLLVNFIGKEGLRDQIDDRLQIAQWDWLDIDKYPGTRDECIQEIFEQLEDEIDYGNSVSDDEIDERIDDIGMYYNLEKEA